MIFGRNKDKLEKIRSTMGIDVTDCADDILANNEIDLIDICLPITLHREYALRALEHGKDVFCETPICLSLEDDLGLQNIATNLMIHELDFITWLLGSPTKISAFGMNGMKGQSHVIALLTYKDTTAEIQSSSMMPRAHPFTVGYEAIFEKGTVSYTEYGYADRCEKSLTLYTDQSKEDLQIAEHDCYEEAIKHAIDCRNRNTPSRLSLDDAIKSLQLALQIKDRLIAD